MQPPENHVAMMQIDCEVINTRLLHIHQDSIPAHLSQGMRADTNNASLQRNDSHEEQSGIHHHYEDFSTPRSSPPKYESPLYRKPKTQPEAFGKGGYIDDEKYIRVPSSSTRRQLPTRKRKNLKLSDNRFTP